MFRKASVPYLASTDPFPDPAQADPKGFVAITRELTPQLLLKAYSKGIFPWTENPFSWWSPDPRGILPLDQLHVPTRLNRTIRSGQFTFTMNQAFKDVIRGCAQPAQGREESWIGPTFIEAYTQLHEMGYAVSFEVWQDTQLAGGLYGVKIGHFFAGESMFHLVRDASSVALVLAARALKAEGCRLFDLQMITPHTARFGGVEIRRSEYLKLLQRAIG
ncbi:MAG: leucyl/phenylalanyl-tRNA--protein transferase [Verrucomicrobia bacterium]|nr:leucyl/phenylalanyl-tRNA--protein transferase [Verrucomicrobiota bacterium]